MGFTARELREHGNALYKSGKLNEAIKIYHDAAHNASEDDYLPWSNLSAAYFETGNYKQAAHCAVKALSLCHQHHQANATCLEQKLAPRILRAYLHAHQHDMARAWLKQLSDSHTLPADELQQYQSSLDQAQAAWRAMPDEKAHRGRLAADVPRYRPAFAGYQEFYTVGHDEVTDLLGLPLCSDVKKDISVFFGGIGDARHFYGQLALLGAMERISSSHAAGPIKRRYHFTLNDSKASVLARDMVLFAMLDELAVSKDMLQTERTEIYTVVYYVFVGIIIPRFAVRRLHRVIDRVIEGLEKGGNGLLPWMRVYEKDRAEIVRSLRFWKAQDDGGGPLAALYSTGATIDRAVFQIRQQDVSQEIMYGTDSRRAPPGCQREFKTYPEAPFLQPPRSILKDHEPELLRLLETEASTEKLRAYLAKNWSTNPTLLDEDWHVKAMGDLDVAHDPFEVYRAMHDILRVQEKGGPRKMKLFDHIASFFQMVVVALRKTRGRLVAELLLDDAAAAIDGIRYGLIEGRESAAPSSFDLVHVSNVADYIGGGFFNFVTASKILGDTSKLMTTCLRNTSLWRSHDEFNSEYMAVSDMKMLSKTTQMKMTDKEDIPMFEMSGYMDWKRESTPFPYELLLPRAELTRFVYTHFLKVALPCGRSLSDHHFAHFIYPTLNLTNFFRLLIHLHEIGYPPHWLADVLNKILDDQVITTARPPQQVPMQPDEITRQNQPARLSVAAFLPEMTTLTALFQRLLPFTPLTASPLPALDSIYEYTIQFAEVGPAPNGEPAAMVLVFFNMHTHVPNVNIRDELDPSPEQSSSGSSAASKLIEFREKGCVVVTTFTWSGRDHQTVRFWMREDVVDKFWTRGDSWWCGLWRVDDWMLMSRAPEEASKLVRGRKWVDGEVGDVDMTGI
ncbi:hypothetical protein BGW36DRAFT_405925 [Talaromyces proteolyticus]|uniref:DUF4470 domain-containing protein n=1 Tax=Talaromyces proteolyticus TaxID=1131652 RepID=A0AAD4KVH1_9EURO|nr:uncharacterized protein BGW36DRAFT_405925 [Talaromyces proteolyticus]KAH8700726.1 hypothetical protein BGW36DRAFT_405925 [Talaromyces proteolyticus]